MKKLSGLLIKNERGQLGIFLGINLIIVMTLLAFIINVGLFVKAKINLQNAVDAAAWAGASTQARQLSNIGYLNWELRNVYKEWMFKYYVLGRLKTIQEFRNDNKNGRTNFRLQSFYERNGKYTPNVFDPYNVPSICMHFESKHGICDMYDVPGLPRFEALGLPSISEHNESFENALVSKKAEECSSRSIINFGTALLWTYGAGDFIMPGTPALAIERPGAWVSSIELAMRMRNLEMIVNRPPVVEGICLNSGSGCIAVDELQSETSDNFPLNERPLKAFWSAFRNLGGGDNKKSDEVLNSFKLTELAPTPFEAPPSGLSSFLIPQGRAIGKSGVPATTKHYLDLQIYPLNLMTFFTSFIADNVSNETGPVQGVQSEAACKSSKTAIPAPGYIFGFVKNHQVMTYYAVKGEVKFVGLLYPFLDREGITLTAYSAAKPFGGRIGPRLFRIDDRAVYPRDDNLESRSASYITGINTSNQFSPGNPIPSVKDFYVSQASDAIGGIPENQGVVKYAIPNLLYDFETEGDLQSSTGGAKVNILRRASTYSQSKQPEEKSGLYDYNQYELFLKAYPEISNGRNLSQFATHQALEKIRRPTRYEAMNYLIPHYEENTAENPENLESLPIAARVGTGPGESPMYRLFAPLEGPDTLYENTAFASVVVKKYLDANAPSINSFLNALKKVADDIRATNQSSLGDISAAANSIHDGRETISGNNNCDTLSLSAKFGHFFKNDVEQCEITPLKNQMEKYFNTQKTKTNYSQDFPFQKFYYATYYKPPSSELTNTLLGTGFNPGPRQGGGSSGENFHPFGLGQNDSNARRNFYSTKFFAIEKILVSSGNFNYGSPALFHERSEMGNISPDLGRTEILNGLSPEELLPYDKYDF